MLQTVLIFFAKIDGKAYYAGKSRESKKNGNGATKKCVRRE